MFANQKRRVHELLYFIINLPGKFIAHINLTKLVKFIWAIIFCPGSIHEKNVVYHNGIF